ncbi:hypothetical protein ACU686_05785 [Yinghuangia aomiensis]
MSASESGGGFRTVLVNWGPTLLFNVVAPLLTYQLLVDHMSGVYALLLSGLWPAAESGGVLRDTPPDRRLRHAHLDVPRPERGRRGPVPQRTHAAPQGVRDHRGLRADLPGDARAAPRPLMFYFGRKFATDGSEAGVAYWNSMWQYEGSAARSGCSPRCGASCT